MTVKHLLTAWQDPSLKARETESSSTPAMSEYIIAPGILNIWMKSRLSQLSGGGEPPELYAERERYKQINSAELTPANQWQEECQAWKKYQSAYWVVVYWLKSRINHL